MADKTSVAPMTSLHFIDRRAIETPDRPWVIVPKAENLEEGYRVITYAAFSAAIDKVAFWLDDNLPRMGMYDTVLYKGPNDVRWAFILFAAQKTRRKLLVLNPNNSIEADLKLITETECRNLLVDSGDKSRAKELLDAGFEHRAVAFPQLAHWLAIEEHHSTYPYEEPKTEEEAFAVPCLITHTSGTTGRPKQIPFSAGYQMLMERQRKACDDGLLEGQIFWQRLRHQRVLMPFPQTWSAGLALIADLCVTWEFVPILFPPTAQQPLSMEVVNDALEHSDATAAILLPFYLKELVKQPRYMDTIRSRKLDMVGYAGASLEPSIIKELEPLVNIIQPIYGSTDAGHLPYLMSGPGDGGYVGISNVTGCDLEKVPGEDEIYELVMKREKDLYRLVHLFNLQPALQTWRSNDLFERHPTKKNFWKPVGRADDLVKNSFLTKTHATHIESVLELDGRIRGACFGGQAERKPFLIVEVDSSLQKSDTGDIVDHIWPIIEAANLNIAEESKLSRESIIIAQQDKQLPRLGKGTLDRRAVTELYKKQIAQVQKL